MTPHLISESDDLSPLAEIHAQCFAQPWTAGALAEQLASPGTSALSVAEGFIMLRVAADEAEILTLAVRPNGRRQGIGRALVRAAAEHCRVRGALYLFLEVASGNDSARRLYEGLGFREVGRRKSYYPDGNGNFEDALILRSNLPLSPLGKRPASS